MWVFHTKKDEQFTSDTSKNFQIDYLQEFVLSESPDERGFSYSGVTDHNHDALGLARHLRWERQVRAHCVYGNSWADRPNPRWEEKNDLDVEILENGQLTALVPLTETPELFSNSFPGINVENMRFQWRRNDSTQIFHYFFLVFTVGKSWKISFAKNKFLYAAEYMHA